MNPAGTSMKSLMSLHRHPHRPAARRYLGREQGQHGPGRTAQTRAG